MNSELVSVIGSCEQDNLIARIEPPARCNGATFAAATGELKRGTLVDISVPTAAVASATGNAILADDIDATDEAVTAACYICGCFNKDAIILADGSEITDAAIDKLRTYGILVVDVM